MRKKLLASLIAVLLGFLTVAVGPTESQVVLDTLDTPNPQPDSRLGFPLANGDADGDGAEDIAVGAPGEGRVYVFSGTTGAVILTLGAPNPQPGSDFAMTLAMGDVSGDGKADIVVGAQLEDMGSNADQGRAYIFSGADGSLLSTLESPAPQIFGYFGFALAIGDTNGDGVGDVGVGAVGEGASPEGRVYLFSGATYTFLRTLNTANPEVTGQFGFALAMADSNGDGAADVAVGAPFESGNDFGRVYLFNGSNGSLIRTVGSPSATVFGNFGWSVAMGDVNADGAADVAVGAPHENFSNKGRAYVLSGATGALLATLTLPNLPNGGLFGSVVAMGDADGDGKADTAVGAPQTDIGSSYRQGRAYLFLASGANMTLDTPSAQPDSRFSEWVAFADINNDSRGEVAVGAPFEDVGERQDQGRVYMFALDTDNDTFSDVSESTIGTNPFAGCGVDAWPPDINNNGFVDVIADLVTVANHFGELPAPVRYDIAPDPPDGVIDVIGDLVRVANLFGESCAP